MTQCIVDLSHNLLTQIFDGGLVSCFIGRGSWQFTVYVQVCLILLSFHMLEFAVLHVVMFLKVASEEWLVRGCASSMRT